MTSLELYETNDFGSIKADIYFSKEMNNSALIILNGMIHNYAIAVSLQNKLFEFVDNGINHFIIDCHNLTSLSLTAGGMAFLELSRVLGLNGLKLILANCNNIHLSEFDYKEFFTFIEIAYENNELDKNIAEEYFRNKHLFEFEVINWPSDISCPICKSIIYMKTMGIVYCNECKTEIAVDKYGKTYLP